MKCWAGWITSWNQDWISSEKISTTSDMQMGEMEEELKNLSVKVKEESKKAVLKLNIQKKWDHGIWSHHFMANRWGNWKQWLTLFSWAPKSLQAVTAAMKLKRRLLLRRKAMTNLNSILKSRDITLPTKVHTVKAMVFPVVMYGCDSWTIQKAEHWRTDAFFKI